MGRFWERQIFSLRGTDATVLIVSHGAIISGLMAYFKSQNYRINNSVNESGGEAWNQKASHCSISEVVLTSLGKGEIIRVGDCSHLLDIETVYSQDYMSCLGP